VAAHARWRPAATSCTRCYARRRSHARTCAGSERGAVRQTADLAGLAGADARRPARRW
jgi:hypothetical protein